MGDVTNSSLPEADSFDPCQIASVMTVTVQRIELGQGGSAEPRKLSGCFF
jgi:hypothetical protein